MAGLRFADLQSRPMEFLDFTSVTLDEFQQLVPPFEAVFHARMAAWRMDGKPWTARRFTVYKNCPQPTPEDRLFFFLTYLKTSALQVVQGRLLRSRRSRSSCRPRSHGARSSHWHSTRRTRRCISIGSGSSMSIAVSSAVALSKTGSASGRRASAMS
jgi:hypothetical protein